MKNQVELHRQHREGQDKYSYFLLAAAGTAIGWALTRTENRALSSSMTALGIAVVCWGGSFWCGCRKLVYVDSFLYSNLELLAIESGTHPEVGADHRMVAAASEGARRGLARNSATGAGLSRWQFRLFVLGGVAYIAWHVIEMVLRSATPSLQPK